MNEEVKIYDDACWGNIGKDIVPSRFYQAFHVDGLYQGDDEGIWYEFDSEEKSTISIDPEYPNYEWNKWGETKNDEVISVTITPASSLKSE